MTEKKTYRELLLDPRWQKKKAEILQRDGYRCTRCKSGTKTLHVHHTQYFKGCNPWEYDNVYLLTVCSGCHLDEHTPERPIAPPKDLEGLYNPNQKTDLELRIERLNNLLLTPTGEILEVPILTKIQQLQIKRRELVRG
jgi:5-methylcytosine-specific restriction endonuclease McrA